MPYSHNGKVSQVFDIEGEGAVVLRAERHDRYPNRAFALHAGMNQNWIEGQDLVNDAPVGVACLGKGAATLRLNTSGFAAEGQDLRVNCSGRDAEPTWMILL